MADAYNNDIRNKGRTKLEKVPEELLNVIQDAMKHRIKQDIDPVGRKWQNYPRFMRAISRDQALRERLKISKFKDDELE